VPYRGRFAPSPTGDLHFGSLVAATASYLHARAAGGRWLVRIEDLDTPRVVPGSADSILRTLEAFGFAWDEPVMYQSTRTDMYRDALDSLFASNNVYYCSCTRAEIQAAQTRTLAPGEELFYPGWCRNGVRSPDRALAVRFCIPHEPIAFEDEIQGRTCIDLATDSGDFVILRRDDLFAYQLAVVVDDAAQAITHVVRGADLLNSTPRQIALQGALGLTQLKYAHVPLATDENLIKLSKSAGAGAVDLRDPVGELWRALRFLRQSPPLELRLNRLPTVWDWAIGNWQVHSMRGIRRAGAEAL
jgi:glutamyl-Q tRNA(Asp) synthetase